MKAKKIKEPTWFARAFWTVERAKTEQIHNQKKKLMELEKLRTHHNARINKARKSGFEIGTWECEHCGDTNETVIPAPEIVDERGCWDSMKTCLGCGRQSFVQVYLDGTIIVTPF